MRGSPSYTPSTSDSSTSASATRHVGDQRGQPVVVAEPDLLGGDRVVLVHDRQHAERQQPLQGPLGVAVVAAPGQVVGGQQHLPDGDARGRRRRRRRSAPAAAGRRWPRPAAVARSRGRPVSASGASPAAIAPEETSTTCASGGRAARRGRRPARAAGGVQPAGQRGQRGGADLDHDPARRRRSSGRAVRSPVRRRPSAQVGVVGPAVVVGRARRAARRAFFAASRSSAPRRVLRLQPRVGAAAAQAGGLLGGERAGRQRRLPVEGDVADGDRGAGDGAGLGQLLLDARAGRAGRPGSRRPRRWRSRSAGPSAPAARRGPRTPSGSSGSRSTVNPPSSTALGRQHDPGRLDRAAGAAR